MQQSKRDVWGELQQQIQASGPQNAETGKGNRMELVTACSTTLEALVIVYGAKAVLAALAFALDGELDPECATAVAQLAVAYRGEVNPRKKEPANA